MELCMEGVLSEGVLSEGVLSYIRMFAQNLKLQDV